MSETQMPTLIRDLGNNYVEVYDGGEHARPMRKDKYEQLIHQNPQPILKSDGWNDKPPIKEKKNNPSNLTTSPGKLNLISIHEAMKSYPEGIQPLWGCFIYESSLVILNSISGVGKTTLCYNLAIQAAKGEPFVSIPFPKQLNVLYADLETPAQLRATKLRRICEENEPDNFHFIAALNFMQDYEEMKAIVLEREINMVIVDTINEAFNTQDEQDNAEANRQFKLVKKLRDETGCCILLLAHIGKGEQGQKVYSTRGASARAATADVVLNLEPVTEEEICLSKVKDRIGGGKEKLHLRKVGEDAFEMIERSDDQDAGLLIRVQRFILALFDEGLTQTREFIEQGQQEGYSKPTVERALTNLREAGKIERIKKGFYRKVVQNDKGNNFTGDDIEDDGSDMPFKEPSITNNYRGDGTDGLSTKDVFIEE